MPTYVYETVSDDPKQVRRFEVEQRMSEKPLVKDPDSGLPVRRVISGGLGFTGVECRSSGGAAPAGGCGAPGCGHAHH
jgi:predicted nucleic acid-binding Zn ribbon protein